jgi:hypothetical protein
VRFLIVYSRSRGELVSIEQFVSGDDQIAELSRREIENNDPDIEIVAMWSKDLETLKATHGRYFVSAPADLQPVLR